jgi:hypothetical protein
MKYTRKGRTDRQYWDNLQIHRTQESALPRKNILQPFMLATGFLNQVFRAISGGLGAA